MIKYLLALLFPVSLLAQPSFTSDGRVVCPVCPPPQIVYRDTGSTKYIYRDTGSIKYVYVKVDTTIYRDTCNKPAPPVTDPNPPTLGKIFKVTSTPVTVNQPKQGGSGPNYWMVATWDDQSAPKIAGSSTPFDVYTRYTWIDFQKDDGSFDWRLFDSRINAAIDKGQKFAFGIMNQYSGVGPSVGGATLNYPLIVHNEMQAELVKDHIYQGAWVINWNSPAYKKWHDIALSAIANHLATTFYKGVLYKNVINQIDIRGWGEVGEAWWDTGDTKSARPTSATLKGLIDAHLKYFADYRLCIMMGYFDPGNWSKTPADIIAYATSIKTNAGDVGWRRDNWGDDGYTALLQSNAAVLNKWKTSPVVGEPLNDQNAVSRCGTMYCDLPKEVSLFHATSIGNGNYPTVNADVRTNVNKAAALMGYQIAIDSGSVSFSDSLRIKIYWSNKGLCPAYDDWVVTYQIGTWTKTSKFNPKLFMGTVTISDAYGLPNLVSGSYDLKVTVTDPKLYMKPLPLNSIINCKVTL